VGAGRGYLSAMEKEKGRNVGEAALQEKWVKTVQSKDSAIVGLCSWANPEMIIIGKGVKDEQ